MVIRALLLGIAVASRECVTFSLSIHGILALISLVQLRPTEADESHSNVDNSNLV